MDKKKKEPEQSQESGWYKSGDTGVDSGPAADGAESSEPSDDSIEWTASEFVAHDKSFGWFALLALCALALAALLYLVTRDMFTAVVVVIMAAILGVAGARKPRVISYRLDRSGLTAGKKFFPYRNYKSFAMPDDGPFTSIVLIPMKRFDFPTSAYLAPDSQEKAIEALADHLPMELGELDNVERLMRQLRF